MNSIETIALSKIISDRDAKIARPNLPLGEHSVDLTIRVSGRMTVGEDYDVAPTVSIPLKETMALLLYRMGFQRDKAIEILREVMTEAIGTTGRGKDALAAALPIVNDAMDLVTEQVIAQLPRQSRRGVVKTYLAIEEIVTTA